MTQCAEDYRNKEDINYIPETATEIRALIRLRLVQDLIDRHALLLPKLEDVLHRLEQGELPPSTAILKCYGSGQRAYLSEPFRSFREVGRFYETLGLFTRLGHIDFEIIYEIIGFPDHFWRQTTSLQQTLSQHWYRKDSPLDDFWKNFDHLRREYLSFRPSA